MRAHYANPTHPCTSVRWQVADNSFPICPWTYRVFTGVLLGGGVIEGLIGTQEIYLQERKPKHKHVSLTILMRTELVTP